MKYTRRKSYQSVVYNDSEKPLTDYPSIFARYLKNRFSLKDGFHLLDAGCGRAEMLNAFTEIGLKCFGCDLELPSDECTSCEVKSVDFASQPLPYFDNTFDVVFSKSVIEHLHNPENYTSEIYRVLKPNGLFIALVPDWESQWKVFYEDHTHVQPYVPMALKNLLLMQGFLDVTVEKFSHHPYCWNKKVFFGGGIFSSPLTDWKRTFYEIIKVLLRLFLSTPRARWLTEITGIKYFRWSVELQILGVGRKNELVD